MTTSRLLHFHPASGGSRAIQMAAWGVLCLVAISGCQQADEWPRAAVKGNVTLDGTPLSSGEITFFPAGNTAGPAAGATITNGQFSLKVHEGPVVGRNRIEIRSVQKTGRMVESPVAVESDGPATVDGMMVEEFAEVVPRQYNRDSELEQEIVSGKVNDLDFPLISSATTPER